MKDSVMLQLETAKWALHRNLEGLSHEDSLVTPERGGNHANWIVGHLATAYSNLLKALGEEGTCGEEMAAYERGSDPLDPAHARPFGELLATFDQSHDRVVAKLGDLTAEDLAQASPVSPRNDPKETIGSFLSLIAFHQTYHVGQIGLLRRVVGQEGAIA